MSDHSASKENKNNQQEKTGDSLYFLFMLFQAACMVVSAFLINFSIAKMAEHFSAFNVGIFLIGFLSFLINFLSFLANGRMLTKVILPRRG